MFPRDIGNHAMPFRPPGKATGGHEQQQRREYGGTPHILHEFYLLRSRRFTAEQKTLGRSQAQLLNWNSPSIGIVRWALFPHQTNQQTRGCDNFTPWYSQTALVCVAPTQG
jgi:hypothetical protein